MTNPDDIWDEFRWEEFMKEQDKKVDRFMELFYRYHGHPNREELIASAIGRTWLRDQSGYPMDARAPIEDEEVEGEEWKALAGFEESMDVEFEHHPIYIKAKEFALRAYHFVDGLSESMREDSAVVDFIANAMVAPAKIAGGTGMGDGIEELGANIAYCKRGLAATNLAIGALCEMKEKKIVDVSSYRELLNDAVEVRNTIAMHILTLREKFLLRIP